MTAIERIFQFIEYKKVSASEFSKLIQVSNGYLAKQRTASANIGSHIIEKIVSVFPELNTDWIITGRGCMLNSQNESNKNGNLNSNLNGNLSPNSQDNPQYPTMAVEPSVQHESTPNLSVYKRSEAEEIQPPRDTGSNELIKHLIEQLNEKSEEIGALKQENSALKNQVAELVEDALNAERAHA